MPDPKNYPVIEKRWHITAGENLPVGSGFREGLEETLSIYLMTTAF